MGGRSRKYDKKENWDWLRELSDERLENYGHMAAKSLRQNDSPVDAATKQITLNQREALYDNVAKEYERRNGEKPDWYSSWPIWRRLS